MSRIRMAVEIHNESDAPLQFKGAHLEVGDWTPGWQPPAVINPNASGQFRSEGGLLGVPTTGTEGFARYQIGDDSSLELHIGWNSPLVESSYGNKFHVRTPPNWEGAHWGGQGGQARLHVRIRPTADRRVQGFSPAVNGLHFSNRDWRDSLPAMTVGFLWNRLLDAMPDLAREALRISRADDNWLPFTRSSSGMCGGMVFTVMDLWAQRLLPPRMTQTPTTADDLIFQHIRARLLDSFDVTGGGHRYLGYSSPHYPNGDEGFIQFTGLTRGRSWITYREEWPKIRGDIDADRLSPMALIQTQDLGIDKNHQVLAYGYRQSGQQVSLFIYDPNFPNEECTLTFDITRTDGEVHVGRSHGRNRILAFYRTDGYAPRTAPWGPDAMRSVTAAHTRDQIAGSCSLFALDARGRIWSQYWPLEESTRWSGWFQLGTNTFPTHAPITAIKTRALEGSCTLFLTGLDGRVWTTFWPSSVGADWSAWSPVGDGKFPPGAPVAAIRTRTDIEGACTLFAVAPGGQVWSAYWPSPGSTNWTGWFPIGDNKFPPGAPITAIKTRGTQGSCSLFIVGNDQRVWSAYWPAPGTSNWTGWFPIGENKFPIGSRVTAQKPRRDDGSCSLYVTGQDGRVWSTYWPQPGTANWSAWFPIGNGRFPPGAPVTAVKTRLNIEGDCSLFAVAPGGQVWSAYWPSPGTSNWTGWFPIGENVFKPASPVFAVRTRSDPGSCTLFIIGHDGRVWSAYWPSPGTSDWTGWFPVADSAI